MISEGLEEAPRKEEDLMECTDGSVAIETSSSKSEQTSPNFLPLRPQNIENKADPDLNSYIFETLKETTSNGPVNLFRAMINPDSFSQSAENLAAIFELVKEKKIGVYEGEDGDPYIYIVGSGLQAA